MIVCKTRMYALTILTAIAVIGCSGGTSAPGAPDAGSDGPGGGSDAASDCVQMQQAYVNAVLAPDQQTDVAATVHAVLAASDFPQAMPYCSGARPGAR
jgi:hypothetical protein